jgi:hypothetical protein
MKKRILASLLAIGVSGFAAGYLVHEYQNATTRMTRFADIYDCCGKAALVKLLYSQQAEDLSGISAKARSEELTNLDWAMLSNIWWRAATLDIQQKTFLKQSVSNPEWLLALTADSRSATNKMLKDGKLSAEDVRALASLYEEAAFSSQTPAISNEQEKQIAYLLKRAPDLSVALNAAQKTLTDAARDKGITPLDLYGDLTDYRNNNIFDAVALCQVRPSIFTGNPDTSFKECLRGG